MRTITKALVLATAITVGPGLVLAQNNTIKTLTLSECEALALENSGAIQSAELGVEISQAKQRQASHASILPVFEVKNVWGPIPRARGVVDPETGFVRSPDTTTSIPGDLRYFTQFDLDLVQPLFTFGRLSGLQEAATYGVRAEEAKLENETADVLLKVRKLYWSLVLGKALLAVVQEVDAELAKARNRIEEKLDEGSEEVSQTDLFKVQIFRYEVNKRLREAENKIELARTSLRTVLGMPEDVEIHVATEYLDPLRVPLDSLPVYIELGLKHRPELSRIRAGLQAKGAMIRVARSEYYPQFFFGGQVKFNFAKDRFDPRNPFLYNPTNYFRPGFVLGFNMNLNFLQIRDKIRVAQAEQVKLAYEEERLVEGIKLDIEKAYREVKAVEKNISDSRRALQASENWLRSATMTFDIGLGEVKDLIDAFKSNSTMKGEHYQNIFEYNVALARLSKAVGVDLYANRNE